MAKKKVTIGITKRPATGEFVVFWKEGNKCDEGKACYENAQKDAAGTLKATAKWAKKKGYQVKISKAVATERIMKKYGRSDTKEGNMRAFKPDFSKGRAFKPERGTAHGLYCTYRKRSAGGMMKWFAECEGYKGSFSSVPAIKVWANKIAKAHGTFSKDIVFNRIG